MKKILCGLIMIFFLLGFVSAIYEYAGGYDEVPATVTKVYVARSSHKGPLRIVVTRQLIVLRVENYVTPHGYSYQ